MSRERSLLQVFTSRKMAYLLLLSFSSGMPLYLTSQTLQSWLTVEGIDLRTVGFISLVALPYSLKFIWSPLLDRFSLPVLGRRRGWMALTQVLLFASIAAMAFGRPAENIGFLAAMAVAVAFLSATQDVAVDAYRRDVLDEPEMGAGAGVTVLGYRVALFVTGAGALVLADWLSWPTVYVMMAAFMLVGIVGSFRAPEPVDPGSRPSSIETAVREPVLEFFRRLGFGTAALTLVFIGVYKLGDAFVSNMTTPFLLDIGFSQTDIGVVRGGMGLAATILGTLVGGAWLSRFGILRSLWLFGLLQAGSNLVYLVLAETGHNYPLLVLTINVEYFTTGMGTAAFLAFLMSLSNRRYSATQYALLSSLMAFCRDVGAAPSGWIAETTGWPLFFATSFLAALPGLALVRALERSFSRSPAPSEGSLVVS